MTAKKRKHSGYTTTAYTTVRLRSDLAEELRAMYSRVPMSTLVSTAVAAMLKGDVHPEVGTPQRLSENEARAMCGLSDYHRCSWWRFRTKHGIRFRRDSLGDGYDRDEILAALTLEGKGVKL